MRFWNYLYYFSWRLQESIGRFLIERPLAYIFGLIPFFRKNWEKGKKDYERFVYDRKLSLNMVYAFCYMLITTIIIYASIALPLVVALDQDVDMNLKYYLLGVLLLAYLTNYYFLWRNDRYMRYFKEFDNRFFSRIHYFYVILFHVAAIAVCILSIYSIQR